MVYGTDRVPERRPTGIEIDIVPSQPEGFTSTATGGGEEQERDVIAAGLFGIEESSERDG